jgi:ligand-binding SRPBCC domain-containing protein
VNPLRFSRTPEGLFTLEAELWLPRQRDEVFRFFADAFNLEALTPPWLKFEVLTPRPIEMRVGLRIDYRLRLRGLPLRWQSEITAWEPPVRFVDEQRRGPYRAWIHEHTFEARDGGTLARDHVRYAVALDFLVHRLFVRPDMERIFQFRSEALRKRFPALGRTQA